jgi:WXG100 family type VII secretion target
MESPYPPSGGSAGDDDIRKGNAVANVIAAEEGALKRGAQAVETAKNGIDQQMNTVRGEIEEVKGYWTGDAQQAFNGLMQRWDDQARKLNAVLITLQDALQGTDTDQNTTEQSHEQSISHLSSMMGA